MRESGARPELIWHGKGRAPSTPAHRLASLPGAPGEVVSQGQGAHGVAAPDTGPAKTGKSLDPWDANMLIAGDNLPALELLAAQRPGSVQCVYIDPPFNAGANQEMYEDGLDHHAWLDRMSRRLRLVHTLLADTGSLFVHLDDNELDYLKVMLDEIFGRGCFVARITVDARAPSAFSTVNRGVFKASEYLLWYARDRGRMVEYPLRTPRDRDRAYSKWLENPDEPCERWRFTTLRKAYQQAHPEQSRPEEPDLYRFAVQNARQVFRLAAISDRGAGKDIVALKYRSREHPGRVFELPREGKLDTVYVVNGQQMSFYAKNISEVDGVATASRPLTNVWTDIAWEGIAGEGGVRFKKGKKPERLVRRCLQLTTRPGDLVLDAFAGSGTTGAVAHKMARRWWMIENGEQWKSHILPRMQAVVSGQDRGGISKLEGWQGGAGFLVRGLEPVQPVDGTPATKSPAAAPPTVLPTLL